MTESRALNVVGKRRGGVKHLGKGFTGRRRKREGEGSEVHRGHFMSGGKALSTQLGVERGARSYTCMIIKPPTPKSKEGSLLGRKEGGKVGRGRSLKRLNSSYKGMSFRSPTGLLTCGNESGTYRS